MSGEPPPGTCTGDHCITCADEGIAMRVVTLDAATGLARCAAEGDGGERTVDLALVDAGVGDLVLVHADTALVRLEEAA